MHTYQTTVVIPAYNEQNRLGETLAALAQLIKQNALAPALIHEVLVVDDGSKDQTARVASEHSATLPGLRVIRYEENRGKGYAVRCGLKQATAEWTLIADADMSTPWVELVHLIGALEKARAKIAIASRDLGDSKITRHQSFIREHLGKTFNYFVRFLTQLEFRDTQCGFKLLHNPSIAPIVKALEVDRFAWDVEVLMLARSLGIGIVEVPVQWEHKDDSRVSLFKDGMAMVGSVVSIRSRLLQHKFLHRGAFAKK